ncbi:MAG: glycosyltransferase [Ignavibacteriaceae bacterium]
MDKVNLNILIITVRADFGGGPEHIYSLLKELYKENNFYIACPDDFPYKKKYAEILGENRIILIPHREFKISYLFTLKNFIKEKKIKIVHSHGKGAGIYSRFLSILSGIPCIHTFHGLHTGSYNHFQKLSYLFLEKILSLFTKKFISVSRGEFKEIIDNKITRPKKIAIIENGVEIPDSIISKDNFFSSPKNLITFTRFNFQKNSSKLIFIFEELKKQKKADLFKIVLLGTGEEENEIKKMCIEHNLSSLFNFKGITENRFDYLKNSFCYISTSRWEGMPLSILEAMSYGVPVAATNVVGNNDIVEHNKTGFLYNIDNPKEAADYIIKLSENFELWKSISEASRNKIQLNFSLEKMAAETQKIYNSI